MSTQVRRSDDAGHVADLLPAYVNLTLEDEDVARVRTHLARCPACRDDLAFWTSVAALTIQAAATAQNAPSLALLEAVWAKQNFAEAPSTPTVALVQRRVRSSIGQAKRRWAILRRQFMLLTD